MLVLKSKSSSALIVSTILNILGSAFVMPCGTPSSNSFSSSSSMINSFLRAIFLSS